HRVVRAGELHLKRAARQHVVAVVHASLARIFERHPQHRRPVQPGLSPWPTARNTSNSIAAFRAKVRWKACRFSNTIDGVNGPPDGASGCITKSRLFRET